MEVIRNFYTIERVPHINYGLFSSYIGDCQIGAACIDFINTHGKVVIEKKLYKNFILHMVNLFDFSLIRPEEVQRALLQLEQLKGLS